MEYADRAIIKATGSYIPEITVKNENFENHIFYEQDSKPCLKSNDEIIRKFEEITGIKERKYVSDDLCTSDIGCLAAGNAFESSGIDKESIDYIIAAHNFGDIKAGSRLSDFVPSIAARIKYKLGINNPYTVAYDLPFGCPGWLQGLIQAGIFLGNTAAKRALVIGAETLSRVSDPHDRDSMIYSDGAGAVILEKTDGKNDSGILSYCSRSDTKGHLNLLTMGKSYNPDYQGDNHFLKMQGHKLYKYALQFVPGVVKKSLDDAGLALSDVSKLFLHQANAKMDEEIARRLFELYGKSEAGSDEIFELMPMTISWLGNSSVATLPTLLDLTFKHKINGHECGKGDIIVMASVGAGMNINSLVYRI